MRRAGIEYQTAADRVSGVMKTAIDEWASGTVAKVLNFKPGDSVADVVAKIGGRLHYDDSAESPDGGTIYVHGEGNFDILLPTWTSPKRDRFTIAHELGHYCLHSQFGKFPLIASRSGTGRAEWEANWFAAAFLMPAKIFREHVASGMSNVAIAAIFDVSVPAIEVRKKSLGI